MHNSTKATHIVVLKERRIRRELKDLVFPHTSMEEKVLHFVQDDNIAELLGYAKVSLARGALHNGIVAVRGVQRLGLLTFSTAGILPACQRDAGVTKTAG